MGVPIITLVADVRQMSSLLGNQFCTDPEIGGYLSDAMADLGDDFVAVLGENYIADSFAFTFNGSTNIVALPTNFQKALGVDLVTGSRPATVPMLPSYAMRNGVYDGYWLPGNGIGRCWWVQGSANQGQSLTIYPNAQCAIGSYVLQFVPQMPQLFDGTIPWTSGDFAVSFTNDITIHAGNFDASYIGGTLTIAGSASNNGTSTILSIDSSDHIVVSGPLTGESFPNTTTFVAQPFGSRNTVPDFMTPWVLYLKVHASIAIRTKRQQDTSDLQAKLQQQKLRIQKLAPNKSLDVIQAPVTRRWMSGFGGGVGRGWW